MHPEEPLAVPADALPTPKKPKVGRPKVVFDEALAVAQYQRGYSVGDLAKYHAISMSTAINALKRAGIICRGSRYRKPKDLPPLGPEQADAPEIAALP